jgi:hypothetical protein
LDFGQVFSQFAATFAKPVLSIDDDDDEAVSRGIDVNNGAFVAFRRAAITAELNWQKSGGENSIYLTPGIVWTLPHNLELGGMTKSADDFRTILKLTYDFGGAKEIRRTVHELRLHLQKYVEPDSTGISDEDSLQLLSGLLAVLSIFAVVAALLITTNREMHRDIVCLCAIQPKRKSLSYGASRPGGRRAHRK